MREVFNVDQRIAVDDEQVGIGARPNTSKLVVHLQQGGIAGRCLAQEVDRGEHFPSDEEFASAVPVRITQEVRAKADWAEAEAAARLTKSEDHREGARAFAERRKPTFRGR